jgi:hypothetical protein
MDGASGNGGGGHVDEGTIHAWLDDALDAERAARVASHVESCPECAAAVAEARGLIAGASRVVRALDDPAVSPAAGPAWGGGASPAKGSGSLWRMLRVTPARAAIAASLLVALGVTLTYPRRGLEETAQLENAVSTMSSQAAAPANARDALLDSAVKRNVATAQPPRAVEAAPGPAIPQAPGPGEYAAAVDTGAPARVAEGRATVRAMRESSAPAPDQSRTAGAVPVAKEAVVPALAAADAPGVATKMPARRAAPALTIPARGDSAASQAYTAAECYRVESAASGATWGPVPLPFVVALQPTTSTVERGGAVIIDPGTGSRSEATARWSRRAGDTLQLDLRRIGFTGQLVLAAGEEARKGTMRSAQSALELSPGVVTGATARAESGVAAGRVSGGQRARAAAPPGISTRRAAPAAAAELDLVQPVAARRVSCPAER